MADALYHSAAAAVARATSNALIRARSSAAITEQRRHEPCVAANASADQHQQSSCCTGSNRKMLIADAFLRDGAMSKIARMNSKVQRRGAARTKVQRLYAVQEQPFCAHKQIRAEMRADARF